MGSDPPDNCGRIQTERCIIIRAVQAILGDHMKHEPICLPELRQITNTKQYRSPGVQEEISRMVQEFEK